MPVAPSQLDICNEALASVHAAGIADINENSNEARLCRIFYPKLVARALEGPHDWGFANQRVQLAPAPSNPRPFEWAFAYLMPQNCGSPIRVMPDLPSIGDVAEVPTAGVPYAETHSILKRFEFPYEIESGTLYTGCENAWLEYTINDITGVPVTQLFAAALAAELASKLAVSLKADSNVKKDAIAESELAWQRAIADDNNRQPQSYGDYESEAMVARHGGGRDWPECW